MKKLYTIILIAFISINTNAQNVWTQKANFGGIARQGAIAFSIGTKGYIGLGASASSPFTNYQDFWEWDQATNVWTQKTNYPGAGYLGSIGFSIGTKGYVGTGYTNNVLHNDFWEWDQATNTWTPKTNYPGGNKYGVSAFTIGNKGYAGMGSTGGPPYHNDFWEYNPSTDSWAQKANYPFNRIACSVFSIGSKGYACNGNDDNRDPQVTVYEYDPSNNSWTQKTNFGGSPRSGDIGFSFTGKGYVGLGYANLVNYSDFWEYDPTANSWTPRANFGGIARYSPVGFSIGSYGYIGTGSDVNNCYQDFWEYSPINVGVNEINLDNSISVYPNPSNGKFTLNSEIAKVEIYIYTISGEKIYSSTINSTKSEINLSNLTNGVYFLQLKTEQGLATKKIVISK